MFWQPRLAVEKNVKYYPVSGLTNTKWDENVIHAGILLSSWYLIIFLLFSQGHSNKTHILYIMLESGDSESHAV